VTAVARFEGRRCVIAFEDPLATETTTLGGYTFPLAADFTVPLAVLLAETDYHKLELARMLDPQKYAGTARIARLQPYDPNKTVVLVIHGLQDSAATWAPMINDLRGHISGDAVITRTAQAIRESLREDDERARLGGDEFIVFFPDCDTEGAAKIAEGIRARLSNQRMPLAGGKFSVSIVISVQDGTSADFTRMYQDADAALYHAREDGKSGFGL